MQCSGKPEEITNGYRVTGAAAVTAQPPGPTYNVSVTARWQRASPRRCTALDLRAVRVEVSADLDEGRAVIPHGLRFHP